MVKEATRAVDLEDMVGLGDLVAEARVAGEAVLLRRGGEPVAVLQPLAPGVTEATIREALAGGAFLGSVQTPRRRTEADREAFLRAAGSWEGIVEVDELIRDVYESRARGADPDPSEA
jgi:antitoxin (DNA-binding transcriptional repressor) of toxin-antitoxin stability system